MSKRLNGGQVERRAKAHRERALSRGELRLPTTPRTAPASPTSMPIKVTDPRDAALIEAFLRQKSGGDK